jgi:hypothetical protein
MLVFSRVSVAPPGVGDARVFSCRCGPRGGVMLAFSRVSVAHPRGWVMLACSRLSVAPRGG